VGESESARARERARKVERKSEKQRARQSGERENRATGGGGKIQVELACFILPFEQFLSILQTLVQLIRGIRYLKIQLLIKHSPSTVGRPKGRPKGKMQKVGHQRLSLFAQLAASDPPARR
jgi:hypothetical protein